MKTAVALNGATAIFLMASDADVDILSDIGIERWRRH